ASRPEEDDRVTLLRALSECPDERPDAIRIDGRPISGTALLRSATAVADRVRGLDRVAVEATPSLETVIGIVGALPAGGVVRPVPPDAGARERAHVIRD